MKICIYACLFVLALGAGVALAGDTQVTVYNNDLGLVKEVRTLEVKEGQKQLAFTDVAARLIPTSVHFRPLNGDPDFRILEQNFEYDLVSPEKILEKYIDHPVELIGESGDLIKGTLLSRDGNSLVLKTEDGIRIVAWNDRMSVNVKELPQGLSTRPTLIWELAGAAGGSRAFHLSYLTGGMGWHAEYVGLLSEDGSDVILNSWVSVENRSGAVFEDARLKLVAGEVHRAPKPRFRRGEMFEEGVMLAPKAAGGFEERGFFEYHIYELERPTTLKNNQIKQIVLYAPARVKSEKKFYYNAQMDPKKVSVRLFFKNDQKSGLGKPLPAGVFRIYKEDAGSMEFAGEDRISHTSLGEEVKITLGTAFDLLGERKVLKRDKVSRNSERSTIEIELRNNKPDEGATIIVEESMAGRYWQIEESNFPYIRKDAGTVEFSIPVKAGGKEKLQYKVLSSW